MESSWLRHNCLLKVKTYLLSGHWHIRQKVYLKCLLADIVKRSNNLIRIAIISVSLFHFYLSHTEQKKAIEFKQRKWSQWKQIEASIVTNEII